MIAAAPHDPIESTHHGVDGIRMMRSGERAHVLHTWAEGFKGSPAMRRKVWRDYKAMDVPRLADAIDRRDTHVAMAIGSDGAPIGWLAFARWPSIDAVHWVHTALPRRNSGVMRVLFDSVVLKPRLVYTHQSEVRRGGKDRADQWLSRWLADRGHIVSYTPYAEWSR